MSRCKNIAGLSIATTIIGLLASSPALADHLDRWEMRHVVRQLEERDDALQDRIADWVSEGRDDREHRAQDTLHDAEHFDEALAQFKIDLYHHDEPWDLRDNARGVIEAADDFGHSIERGELHGEVRHEWEEMRHTANELARSYHLPEIE